MKQVIAGCLAVVLGLTLSHTVSAGPHKSDFQDIQRWQQKQINVGVKRGELTVKEEQRLRKQQRHLRKMRRDFAADGVFTRGERHKLKDGFAQAGKRIIRLRNNDRYRFYRVRISAVGKHADFGGDRIGFWYPAEQRLVMR